MKEHYETSLYKILEDHPIVLYTLWDGFSKGPPGVRFSFGEVLLSLYVINTKSEA